MPSHHESPSVDTAMIALIVPRVMACTIPDTVDTASNTTGINTSMSLYYTMLPDVMPDSMVLMLCVVYVVVCVFGEVRAC